MITNLLRLILAPLHSRRGAPKCRARARLRSFALFAALGLILGVLGEPGAGLAQSERVLYAFSDQRYASPTNLLLSNGALLGTTYGMKGARNCCGEVYKLSQKAGGWEFHRLIRFDGKTGGRVPFYGVIRGSGGLLYGTTDAGGIHHAGTVFQLQKSTGTWTADFIWNFSKRKRASYPSSNLIMDGSGSLYGEADGGTHASGVVFELTLSGGAWKEAVLHNFRAGNDGSVPSGGLLMDTPDSIWGTTQSGGGPWCAESPCGTVFHLVQSGGVWSEKIVHRFGKGSDGGVPVGALIEDADGDLYGTTNTGGAHGDGTVFEISPSKSGDWNEKVIYSFCANTGCSDGTEPVSGLTWGTNQTTLYGTTPVGGDDSCNLGAGCGTAFSLVKSGDAWTESIVHNFEAGDDGKFPVGVVSVDPSGDLYGTTIDGGTHNLGTIWEITP